MIRIIVKRRKTCRISGLDREWFETFDADLPEVERALGGGFGENGSLAGSVIGAEVLTDRPQSAGDGVRVTDEDARAVQRLVDRIDLDFVPGTYGDLGAAIEAAEPALRRIAALVAREGGAS